MKILICGAGKVGFSIASYLEKTNHDVIVIDQSPELVRNLSERYDVRAITGFASDPNVLKEAGAEDADMLIAVTQSDEVNMIVCEVGHAVFKIPVKIARIRNQSYLSPEWIHLFEERNLSVDVVISPEVEIARAIYRGLSLAGAFSVTPMAEERVHIVGVRCTSETPIVNTPISHINSLYPEAEYTLACIYRGNRIIIPDMKERLLVGDDIYFVCSKEQMPEAMRSFGHFQQSSRRILVIGAGNIGASLAQLIEENHSGEISVRIVERNHDRAIAVAQLLEKSEVLEGDALALEVLQEAGVSKTDTVVAITQDDKVNVLASLLAKQAGAQRAHALINAPETIPLVKSLGVDSVINPREITVSSILRHIRQGNINSVYTMRNNLAEILETEITEKSSLAGTTMSEIAVPGQIKLCAVVRGEQVLMPSPSLSFQSGDKLILIATREYIHEIEKLFSARLDYF